jgi:xylulokinase
VKENQPEIYRQVYKFMLPGDFIAMKLTGEVKTTVSGLSEGILWDYLQQRPADFLLDYYGISPDLLPEITPLFSVQGEVTQQAADELGLAPGTKVSYRAGDQPNNAFSLSVLSPGEVAATAGTSGVVYGICDQPLYDKESRVNTFVHVNHTTDNPSYGVLLCVNGTGILNRWLKNTLAGVTYKEMDQMAFEEAPPGSAGLFFYPYGNGAERTLGNKNLGAALYGLDLNVHSRPHLLRAAQEGIVFALNYGVEIMKQMGLEVDTVKAGRANMFLSPLFREVFAMVTGACVELYNTDGAQGAARGAGVGAGIYRDSKEAFVGLTPAGVTEPDAAKAAQYKEIYQEWAAILKKLLS